MTMTKLLQEIENNKRTRLSMIASLLKRKMMMNIKTVSDVGYLLVDVLRFWHSIVDCASFGLLPKVSLLVSVLAPFWLLEVEAVAKMPEVGLPKQQKLQDGYPHTLVCTVKDTKQYA
jgi:hypothetical protein